jgi:hypothetical protein
MMIGLVALIHWLGVSRARKARISRLELNRAAGDAEQHTGSPAITELAGKNVRVVFVSSAAMYYSTSSAPPPTQASLDALMDRVRAVRVYEDGLSGSELRSDTVLLELREPADVAEFRARLRVRDEPGGHCMCFGTSTFEMLGQDDSRLALISVHHGRTLRWDAWAEDATLIDGRPLCEWLARRGVLEPLQELQDNEATERQSEQDWARWVSEMPRALVGVWPGTIRQSYGADIGALQAALDRSLPDERTRILSLLEWYGSGAGPWSGFPVYEQKAEQLLLQFSTAALLHAVDSAKVSSSHMEGAARLFGGWSFNKSRPNDLSLLPKSLKQSFWNHVKNTEDADKLTRARNAFQ